MQHLVSVQIHTYVQDPGSLNAPFERTKLERDTFNIAQSSHFHVFNISYTSCCVTQIFRASDSGLLVFKYNRSSVRQSGISPQKPPESQPPQQHSQVEGEELKRVIVIASFLSCVLAVVGCSCTGRASSFTSSLGKPKLRIRPGERKGAAQVGAFSHS